MAERPVLMAGDQEELQRVHVRLRHVQKVSNQKSAELAQLHPDISKNALIPSAEPDTAVAAAASEALTDGNANENADDASKHAKKRKVTGALSISSVAAAMEAPPAPTTQQLPSTVQITPLKHLLETGHSPELGHVVTRYNTNIPLVKGIGHTYDAFYQSWIDQGGEQAALDEAATSASAEIFAKGSAAEGFAIFDDQVAHAASQQRDANSDTQQDRDQQQQFVKTSRSALAVVAKNVAAKRKQPTKKSIATANNGPIPTRFGMRTGNIGHLPLYAPAPAPPLNSAPLGAKHMTNYLYMKASSSARPLIPYLMAQMERADATLLNPNAPAVSAPKQQPVMLTWNYIQEMAFCEPINDAFHTCIAGTDCVLWNVPHPRGMFLPQQWIPPNALLYWQRKSCLPARTPRYCFACILNHHVNQRIRAKQTGQTTLDNDANFQFRIGVPGEYNIHAFRLNPDGSLEGATRPMRQLVLSQLRPSMLESNGHSFRRFVEDTSLQFRDGSRMISMMLSNPQSHASFEIDTLTNERMILTFLFRIMRDRLRSATNITELPESMMVARLAFIPFELSLRLMQNKDFIRDYMPRDFESNSDYIYRPHDLWSKVTNPRKFERPQLNGYLIFYLLHIRLNAAVELLKKGGGLDTLVAAITTGKSATIPQSDAFRAPRPTPSFSLPEVAQPYPAGQNAWLQSKTGSEVLAADVDNIREKLKSYVKAHEPLSQEIYTRMETMRRIDDIALLDDDNGELWASIKPPSVYESPFFPEDRKYIHYKTLRTVTFQPAPGLRALGLLSQWTDICPAREAAQLSGLCGPTANSHVNWRAHDDHPSKTIAPEEFTLAINSNRTVRIPLVTLLGDFRGLLWWLQQRAAADDSVMNAIYQLAQSNDPLFWKYDYHRTYRTALAAARQNRTSFPFETVLALQLATYACARVAADLQVMYDERQEERADILRKYADLRLRARRRLIEECSAHLDEHTPSDTLRDLYRQLRVHPGFGLELSQRALQEAIYYLHKQAQSYLPLAHAMVTATPPDIGPTDQQLTEPRAQDASLSLLEMFYPYGDSVISQDTLPDCAMLVGYVDMFSEQTSDEPFLDMLQRCLPLGKQRQKSEDFSLDAASAILFARVFLCSNLGAYMHARVRPSFRRALELYAPFHDPRASPMDTLGSVPKLLLLNAMREALVYYIELNPATLHMLQSKQFSGYRRFSRSWLIPMMDQYRTELAAGATPLLLEQSQRTRYAASMPRIEAHDRVDLFRWLVTRLICVISERWVATFTDKQSFAWPSILAPSPDMLIYLAHTTQKLIVTDTSTAAPLYDHLRTKLGVSESVIEVLRKLERTFHGHASRTADADAIIRELDESQQIILCGFFTMLSQHASMHTLQLDSSICQLQLQAVRERFRLSQTDLVDAETSDSQIPLTLISVHFCSIASCRRRKTATIQECGPKYYGNRNVAWDTDRMIPVCKLKRTPHKARKPTGRSGGGGGGGGAGRGANADDSTACDSDGEDDDDDEEDESTSIAGGDDCSVDSRSSRSSQKSIDLLADLDESVTTESVSSAAGSAVGAAGPAAANTGGSGKDQSNKSLAVLLKAFWAQEPSFALAHGAYEIAPADAKISKRYQQLVNKRISLISSIGKAARRDAIQFAHSMFTVPCEETHLDSYLVLGQVIERAGVDGRGYKSESYTLCPGCGCRSLFRMDLWSANGYSCAECDYRTREELSRPGCIGCGKFCMIKSLERHKRKKLKSGDLGNGPVAMDPPPCAVFPPDALNGIPTPQSASSAASAAPSVGRKGGKRKKAEKAAEAVAAIPDIQIATSAREDLLMRAKRNSKTNEKLNVDEWYRYTVSDQREAVREEIYVCGPCAMPRPWLRKLEPICTSAELEFIIKQGIESVEEACQRLAIGAHMFSRQSELRDAEDALAPPIALPQPKTPRKSAGGRKRKSVRFANVH